MLSESSEDDALKEENDDMIELQEEDAVGDSHPFRQMRSIMQFLGGRPPPSRENRREEFKFSGGLSFLHQMQKDQ